MVAGRGDAIGMIEVKGLSRGLRVASLACHAADVTLDGVGYLHSGMVMVTLRGDVASVQTAVAVAVGTLTVAGELQTVSVIARPGPNVEQFVKERSLIRPQGRSFGTANGIGGFRTRRSSCRSASSSTDEKAPLAPPRPTRSDPAGKSQPGGDPAASK